MNKIMFQICITLGFIALLIGCGGDNSSGVTPDPNKELLGSYFGPAYDTSGDHARLTLSIDSVDIFGGISGVVTLEGLSSCFTQASFSGESYDQIGRTGKIHAEGPDSARALLSFSFSSQNSQIILEGGTSKFENSQGVPCFILESAVLRRDNEDPPER